MGLNVRFGAPWQLHDHSLGLGTVTLPYTVRTTRARLSLCCKAAAQNLQCIFPASHESTCCITNARCTSAKRDLPSESVRPSCERLSSGRSITARTALSARLVSSSPSTMRASIIKRMTVSLAVAIPVRLPQSCQTEKNAAECCIRSSPQVLHALAHCVLAGVELMHMIRKGQFSIKGTDAMSFADQFYALAAQVRPV